MPVAKSRRFFGSVAIFFTSWPIALMVCDTGLTPAPRTASAAATKGDIRTRKPSYKLGTGFGSGCGAAGGLAAAVASRLSATTLPRGSARQGQLFEYLPYSRLDDADIFVRRRQ